MHARPQVKKLTSPSASYIWLSRSSKKKNLHTPTQSMPHSYFLLHPYLYVLITSVKTFLLAIFPSNSSITINPLNKVVPEISNLKITCKFCTSLNQQFCFTLPLTYSKNPQIRHQHFLKLALKGSYSFGVYWEMKLFSFLNRVLFFIRRTACCWSEKWFNMGLFPCFWVRDA